MKEENELVGYCNNKITWFPHHTEWVIKIVRNAQPEHGFTTPIYYNPPSLTAEQNRIKAWLDAQHKAVQGKPNEHNYFLWAKKELFNE